MEEKSTRKLLLLIHLLMSIFINVLLIETKVRNATNFNYKIQAAITSLKTNKI